mmetsp:Transcript_13745/g.41580  ORF Transcript_13745/g.41580 Transcript_13745/m.41580 type:complete len:317 (+) Transcript_13745:64-1014(+)
MQRRHAVEEAGEGREEEAPRRKRSCRSTGGLLRRRRRRRSEAKKRNGQGGEDEQHTVAARLAAYSSCSKPRGRNDDVPRPTRSNDRASTQQQEDSQEGRRPLQEEDSVDDGDGEEFDGGAVEEGEELGVLEEDDAPHEGGEPERGEGVGLVLSDDDGVGDREEADHGGVFDEVEDGGLVEGELREAHEFLDLRAEVRQQPDDRIQRQLGLDAVQPLLRRHEPRPRVLAREFFLALRTLHLSERPRLCLWWLLLLRLLLRGIVLLGVGGSLGPRLGRDGHRAAVVFHDVLVVVGLTPRRRCCGLVAAAGFFFFFFFF